MQANLNGYSLLVAQDKSFGWISELTRLEPFQTITRVRSSGAAFTVFLPNVQECAGMTFSVTYAMEDGAATIVTVADNAESLDWTNYAMTAEGDHVLLYSDGYTWIELASTITT